jgi:hypothetical protein
MYRILNENNSCRKHSLNVFTYFCLSFNKRRKKMSTNVETVVLKGHSHSNWRSHPQASVSYLRPRQAVPSADRLWVLLIGVQNQFQHEATLGCGNNSTQISRSVFISLNLRFKLLLLATIETEISKVPPLQ